MRPDEDRRGERFAMVRGQIVARGVRDERVLAAMREVPRHLCCPPESVHLAYGDHPVPIGHGQTMSQPYMVAVMSEALRVEAHHKVLEVGTGSGYQAAVLARLAREVISIERRAELAAQARQRLVTLGASAVRVVLGDGSGGWAEGAPYDRILVTAGAPRLAPALLDQLVEGGVLVAPVGDRRLQELVRVRREGGSFPRETLLSCVFVPLVGIHGWREGTV